MEHLINLQQVENNEDMLKGRIFTEIQLNILKKKLQKKKLNSNEKTYYYKYIKPKLKAMLYFFGINEINISGKEYIIKKRIPKAIEILKRMQKKHKNKKIIISGSFLFNRNYNDIDVFVFTKYNKENYKIGKIDVNFLPESAIDSLFFSSISQISVSNFRFAKKLDFKINIKEVMSLYETLIIFILQKDNYKKELRDLLLRLEYISKKVILNPKQLNEIITNINPRKICEIISQTFINNIVFAYKKDIIKVLKKRIETYKEIPKTYPQNNINLYLTTYSKAIQYAT